MRSARASISSGAGLRLEVEGRGVDAEALARWLRPVLEDMAEMRAAVGTADLGARHSVRAIGDFCHARRGGRLPERRPARARVIFRGGREQLLPADDAEIHSGPFVVVVLAGEWALGAVLLRDPILFGRQSRPQFRFA